MSREPYCRVVGYTFDHDDILCEGCARALLVDGVHEKRLFPVFDESEFDSRPACEGDGCDASLDVTVTAE